MKRLLVFCLLLWPLAVFGQIDSKVIHKIAITELTALKMPVSSPFCLALLPASNNSTTAADPSAELITFLSQEGMHPKKASTCYKALKGNVISVEKLAEDNDRLVLKVAFTDVTIPRGEDLGVLRRRGVYEFTKDVHSEWIIKSYIPEISESASKPKAAQP